MVGALRSTLEQRAAEARLLLLLHSQRERIDATSRELAAVRRQGTRRAGKSNRYITVTVVVTLVA